MNELQEYKRILRENISLLGYQDLRYSMFEGEDNYRNEYQIRIEYINSKFEVYVTGERASVQGKSIYDDFFDAQYAFLQKMQLAILINRRRVKYGEEPEYNCSLWSN